MSSQYDVYMCRNEQLINDAKSLIGHPTRNAMTISYRQILKKLEDAGFSVNIISDKTGYMQSTCVDVKVFKSLGKSRHCAFEQNGASGTIVPGVHFPIR